MNQEHDAMLSQVSRRVLATAGPALRQQQRLLTSKIPSPFHNAWPQGFDPHPAGANVPGNVIREVLLLQAKPI